jgi:hypothetical protein
MSSITRERTLDKAMRLFSERGYQAPGILTGTGDITGTRLP